MGEEIRKSGIEIIGSVPWGTHLCQFYQTKEDLIDILVPYFKAGLENNEFCMWVTSEPLSEKEAEEAMREAVPNFDQYLRRGRMEIVPHGEWYLKDGAFDLQRVLGAWIDKLNQALSKGYDGIRVTGNTAWLEKREWAKFADYEEEVNNAIGKYQMLAICSYPLDKCEASELIDAVNNHQSVLVRQGGKWELIESSERKQAGEVVQESEENLRVYLESVPVGVYIVQDGKFQFVNPQFQKYTGYTEGELLGVDCLSIVHPEDSEKVRENAVQMLKGNRLSPYEFRTVGKGGETLWTIETVTSIHYKRKRATLGNFMDITERAGRGEGEATATRA